MGSQSSLENHMLATAGVPNTDLPLGQATAPEHQ